MGSAGPVLLEGGGRLAAAITQRLQAAGATVERLETSEHGPASTAHLMTASVLVLATDDDAGNVDRATTAPVVIKMFSAELSAHVTARGDGIALSPIAVAAQAFADAALTQERRA